MRRWFPLTVVALCSFAVGWLLRGSGTTAKAEPPEPEPVAEISVSRPDPTDPTGFSSVRFPVAHSGTATKSPGPQRPAEWEIVLYYHTAPPVRYAVYYGAPK